MDNISSQADDDDHQAQTACIHRYPNVKFRGKVGTLKATHQALVYVQANKQKSWQWSTIQKTLIKSMDEERHLLRLVLKPQVEGDSPESAILEVTSRAQVEQMRNEIVAIWKRHRAASSSSAASVRSAPPPPTNAAPVDVPRVKRATSEGGDNRMNTDGGSSSTVKRGQRNNSNKRMPSNSVRKNTSTTGTPGQGRTNIREGPKVQDNQSIDCNMMDKPSSSSQVTTSADEKHPLNKLASVGIEANNNTRHGDDDRIKKQKKRNPVPSIPGAHRVQSAPVNMKAETQQTETSEEFLQQVVRQRANNAPTLMRAQTDLGPSTTTTTNSRTATTRRQKKPLRKTQSHQTPDSSPTRSRSPVRGRVQPPSQSPPRSKNYFPAEEQDMIRTQSSTMVYNSTTTMPTKDAASSMVQAEAALARKTGLMHSLDDEEGEPFVPPTMASAQAMAQAESALARKNTLHDDTIATGTRQPSGNAPPPPTQRLRRSNGPTISTGSQNNGAAARPPPPLARGSSRHSDAPTETTATHSTEDDTLGTLPPTWSQRPSQQLQSAATPPQLRESPSGAQAFMQSLASSPQSSSSRRRQRAQGSAQEPRSNPAPQLRESPSGAQAYLQSLASSPQSRQRQPSQGSSSQGPPRNSNSTPQLRESPSGAQAYLQSLASNPQSSRQSQRAQSSASQRSRNGTPQLRSTTTSSSVVPPPPSAPARARNVERIRRPGAESVPGPDAEANANQQRGEDEDTPAPASLDAGGLPASEGVTSGAGMNLEVDVLVEARLVGSSMGFNTAARSAEFEVIQAEPAQDVKDLRFREMLRNRKVLGSFVCLFCLMLVVILAIVLAFTVGGNSSSSNNNSDSSVAADQVGTDLPAPFTPSPAPVTASATSSLPSPTTTPIVPGVNVVTPQPTNYFSTSVPVLDVVTPSPAPTKQAQEGTSSVLATAFGGEIPYFTQAALRNDGSPQFRAEQWLLQHTNLNEYSPERLLQRFVLATMFYSTNGDEWSFSNNNLWLDHGLDECFWHFNEPPCLEDGVVDSLSMAEFGLDGTIPPEIFFLSSLIVLDLSVNPLLAGSIPTTIAKATALRFLFLDRGGLGGEIPTEIGGATALDILLINNQGIGGGLPSELGQLSKLQDLGIQDLPFDSATIPTELGTLQRLTSLVIAESGDLLGTLPSELGRLTLLERLWFYDTALTGTIPPEFEALTSLTSMRVQNTGVSGFVPENLCPAMEFLMATFLQGCFR